jgi:hypothetical protein
MADAPLFGRRVRVTVVGTTTPVSDHAYNVKEIEDSVVVIEDHRVEFDIQHNLKKHPNSCQIKITNLSEANRTAFKQSPLKVTLEAGYIDSLSTIFSGDVTFVMSTLDGPNWITVIEGGDGDRLLAHARVSKSFAPGTPVKSVLADALESAGKRLPANITSHPAFQKVLDGGLAMVGKLSPELEKLLKPMGYSMSIQDGAPVILREDEVAGDIYTLGEAQGMIGSPEFGKPTKKGRPPEVTIRCLLYPQIRAGHPVDVTSRDLNGTFKVKSVKHRGDTHGPDWMTEVEVTPTDPNLNFKPKKKSKR